jgi:hypothetical protein
MRYAKGLCWIGDCRIPFEDTQNPATNPKYRLEGNYKMPEKGQISEGSITKFQSSLNEIDVKGRFTPNLLVCDDMLNDGVITKQSKRTYKPTEHTGSLFGNSPQAHGVGIGDSGSSSRYYDLDKWFDKVIDEIR